jgi:hypothetical protein
MMGNVQELITTLIAKLLAILKVCWAGVGDRRNRRRGHLVQIRVERC